MHQYIHRCCTTTQILILFTSLSGTLASFLLPPNIPIDGSWACAKAGTISTFHICSLFQLKHNCTNVGVIFATDEFRSSRNARLTFSFGTTAYLWVGDTQLFSGHGNPETVWEKYVTGLTSLENWKEQADTTKNLMRRQLWRPLYAVRLIHPCLMPLWSSEHFYNSISDYQQSKHWHIFYHRHTCEIRLHWSFVVDTDREE